VNPRRRLAPFLLLGLLTVGAGLGVGLGLSEGAVRHGATAAPLVVIIRESHSCTDTGTGAECAVWTCEERATRAAEKARPMGATAENTALKAVLSKCDHGRALAPLSQKAGNSGSFQHFFENPAVSRKR
jgi:hypothetical protein